jgi:hypothetical protein
MSNKIEDTPWAKRRFLERFIPRLKTENQFFQPARGGDPRIGVFESPDTLLKAYADYNDTRKEKTKEKRQMAKAARPGPVIGADRTVLPRPELAIPAVPSQPSAPVPGSSRTRQPVAQRVQRSRLAQQAQAMQSSMPRSSTQPGRSDDIGSGGGGNVGTSRRTTKRSQDARLLYQEEMDLLKAIELSKQELLSRDVDQDLGQIAIRPSKYTKPGSAPRQPITRVIDPARRRYLESLLDGPTDINDLDLSPEDLDDLRLVQHQRR